MPWGRRPCRDYGKARPGWPRGTGMLWHRVPELSGPAMKRYERANIAAMHGYVPGKQPLSTEAIKLNTNANPYPPSAAVMQALQTITADALRRYPPPTADELRSVIAALHGVELPQVVAVNGGDELLRLALTTFVEPGAPI